VSAALTLLGKLDAKVYERLESLGARLQAGLEGALSKKGVKGRVQRVGSMITLFFTDKQVKSWDDAKGCDTARFGAWHQKMVAQHQYWPPSQFEAAFISAAHTEADIDATIAAAEASLS
jgi:glutamate-1-semialdehyde 2,1-aminomutase